MFQRTSRAAGISRVSLQQSVMCLHRVEVVSAADRTRLTGAAAQLTAALSVRCRRISLPKESCRSNTGEPASDPASLISRQKADQKAEPAMVLANRPHQDRSWPAQAVAWLFVTSVAAWGATPLGTRFTFQGQFKQNGSRVNETCDCRFSLDKMLPN